MNMAEICRAKREMQLLSREWNIVNPNSGKTGLIKFMEKLGENRSQKHRINRVIPYLKDKDFHLGNVNLEAINALWIEEFQRFLLSKLSRNSAAGYESAVRYALKIAVRDSYLVRNPLYGIKSLSLEESDKVFLNSDEVKLLSDTPLTGKYGEVVKRSFFFACCTGLRISDLKSLKWGDIERNPLQLIKRQYKTERKVFVPLNESAWHIINDNKLHNKDELVFSGLPVTDSNGNRYLLRWVKAAGINKQIGWHTARHTFATLTLEQGADIFTISKLLGHKNIQHTQVYAKATDKLRRQAVDALPAIDISS
jgi:integrase